MKTKDTVRKVQTGTLTFKPGDSPIAGVRLIDPATGKELPAGTYTAEVFENGQKIGTYVLDPTPVKNSDGTVSFKVTFTPEGDYTGTPKSLTVRAYDEAGNYADGIYQPEVVGSTPTPTPTPTTRTVTTTNTVTQRLASTSDTAPIEALAVLAAAAGAVAAFTAFAGRRNGRGKHSK